MQNGALGPRRVVEPLLGAVALAVIGLGVILIWWGQGLWREERLPQRLPLDEGAGYQVYREDRLLVFDLDGAAAAVRQAVEKALPPEAREGFPLLTVEEQPLTSLGGRGESWYYKAMPKAVRWQRMAPRRVEVRGDRTALLAQWESIAAAVRRAGGEVLAVRSASLPRGDAGAGSGLRWAEVRLEVGLVASIRGEERRLPVGEVVLARPIPRDDPDFRLAGARVALVIDDWGLPGRGAERLLALPIPLTMAVIPYQLESRAQAEAGAARGWEVLLHLPMEPKNPAWRFSRETIRVGMSKEDIQRLVRLGLLAIPQVRGINNHMGSRATASPEVMRAVLEEVRQRRLFFLDSHTAADSVVSAVAQELRVDYAINEIFLDNEATPEAVRARLLDLVDRAARQGTAVGIGHTRIATAEALAEELPRLMAAGVQFIPLSEAVRRPGAESGLPAQSGKP